VAAVDGVQAPVRRYFEHALGGNTAEARAVRLTMGGRYGTSHRAALGAPSAAAGGAVRDGWVMRWKDAAHGYVPAAAR
jgi:hypothetical protein